MSLVSFTKLHIFCIYLNNFIIILALTLAILPVFVILRPALVRTLFIVIHVLSHH